MAARHLINENGEPFEGGELEALAHELDSLTNEQRTEFRNRNAEAIAKHPAIQILIVAGPGTGKSAIFKQRVLFWLEQDKDAKILALHSEFTSRAACGSPAIPAGALRPFLGNSS